MSALRVVPYVPAVLLITVGLVMNLAAPSKANTTAANKAASASSASSVHAPTTAKSTRPLALHHDSHDSHESHAKASVAPR